MARKNRSRASTAVHILLGVAVCFVCVACDDSSSAVKEPAPDPAPGPDGPGPGGNPDGGLLTDGGEVKDCFVNPKTHFEIINACTTSTRIAKNPTLTKLLPDGGLPPLD